MAKNEIKLTLKKTWIYYPMLFFCAYIKSKWILYKISHVIVANIYISDKVVSKIYISDLLKYDA